MDGLVYQHSVFPTTCELAGIGIPPTVEFPSLAGWLRGSKGPAQESVFCYYRDFQRSVRTHDHRLIVYPQAGRMQLFDLREDPREVHDQSANPRYAKVKSKLLERLREHQRELGDPRPV